MNIDKYTHRLFCLFFLYFILGFINIMAQSDIVKPLSQNTLNPVQTDVFIFGLGAYQKHLGLHTAVNNYYNNNYDVYETHIGFGVKSEFYKRKKANYILGISFGYEYGVCAYDMNVFNNYGIHTHWISSCLDFTANILGFGFKSDYCFLSQLKNARDISYEGLYNDCFNRLSFAFYLGFHVRLTRFKLEARMGHYLKPHLNPQKLSYHSMKHTRIDGSYFEILLYYRVFTTGKVHNSPEAYDD